MGVQSFFAHRATTERATITQDDLNQDVEAWADWLTDEPCRLVVKTQANPLGALAQNPYIRTTKLLLNPDTDVKKGDRIRAITLEDGTVEGPFRIDSILPRRARGAQHHLTLMLEDL